MTTLKKVYELLYKTNDQKWHSVIFGSKKRAKEFLKKEYYIGANVNKHEIINSFIIDRILF